MSNTNQKILTSVVWLVLTISFISLSLEFYLFKISDYDVYRVLNISFFDFLILISILVIQYFLLKRLSFHVNNIWENAQAIKNGKVILLGIAILSGGLYSFLPSQFPFWIFFLLLGSISFYFIFIKRLLSTPVHKAALLLLFGAAMNSSLVFWMHEESNRGRHARYAQQLAESQDTIAENILLEFVDLAKNIPAGIDRKDYWEKQWIKRDYLASNYKFHLDESNSDFSGLFFQPVLTFDKSFTPVYKIFFPEKYTLAFKLNTDFRRSIYSAHQPYKGLRDLDDFHFAVIDKSKVVLSNSHIFNSHILDVDLPSVGNAKKIELKGFDILAYRHSDNVFVLIGEPLSEVQVWISNFAFFFTLLLLVAIFLEVILLLFRKKKVFHYWNDLPIQFRIQIILIGVTCLLFFIIATTTFLFLDQNNSTISYERQFYISEMLRDEILEEEEEYGWKLEDFDVESLAELGDRNECDIDFYTADGTLIVSSFASAKNSPAPSLIDKKTIAQIEKNESLVLLEKQFDEQNKEPYLRTYFGIFSNNTLEGVVSISSYESEIGTSPYIPIVMVKLLNVYVFLLLIAWVGGLLLIGLLTKPLELLASRLSNFKLGKQNEKLNWRGEDAIGQLISEYNKMVDKVEVTTQELIHSEREGAWQVMAQQIAHEINNKLTPLRLNVQFLTRIVDGLNPDESEAVQRITKSLVEKIDGLSKTASQFKILAKLDTPEVLPIELKTFLQQYLNDYVTKDDCTYSINFLLADGQNPIVDMDIRHLQEVLNQIVSNAENAIPENQKGIIEFRISEDDKAVKIEIQDNGKGIDQELFRNIFEPKFSVTSSQTGLGLPICKRIIEYYQGQLAFINQTEGGTIFIITLPRNKTKQANALIAFDHSVN